MAESEGSASLLLRAIESQSRLSSAVVCASSRASMMCRSSIVLLCGILLNAMMSSVEAFNWQRRYSRFSSCLVKSIQLCTSSLEYPLNNNWAVKYLESLFSDQPGPYVSDITNTRSAARTRRGLLARFEKQNQPSRLPLRQYSRAVMEI